MLSATCLRYRLYNLYIVQNVHPNHRQTIVQYNQNKRISYQICKKENKISILVCVFLVESIWNLKKSQLRNAEDTKLINLEDKDLRNAEAYKYR